MRRLAAGLLAASTLLASITAAMAQPRRNGPEYGFRDHQPTQAGVVRRERRAGVAPPPAQVRRNARSVRQLDHRLLHEEAVSPPGGFDRQVPPIQ